MTGPPVSIDSLWDISPKANPASFDALWDKAPSPSLATRVEQAASHPLDTAWEGAKIAGRFVKGLAEPFVSIATRPLVGEATPDASGHYNPALEGFAGKLGVNLENPSPDQEAFVHGVPPQTHRELAASAVSAAAQVLLPKPVGAAGEAIAAAASPLAERLAQSAGGRIINAATKGVVEGSLFGGAASGATGAVRDLRPGEDRTSAILSDVGHGVEGGALAGGILGAGAATLGEGANASARRATRNANEQVIQDAIDKGTGQATIRRRPGGVPAADVPPAEPQSLDALWNQSPKTALSVETSMREDASAPVQQPQSTSINDSAQPYSSPEVSPVPPVPVARATPGSVEVAPEAKRAANAAARQADAPPITQPTAELPQATPQPRPTDVLNVAKLNLDKTAEQRVADQLDQFRLQREQNRQTWREADVNRRQIVQDLLGQNPKALAPAAAKRLSGEELLARRDVVNQNDQMIAHLSQLVESKTLPVAEHEQAVALLNKAVAHNDALLSDLVTGSSQKGRDLNLLRRMANKSLDPDVWLVQAKRMLGDKPLTDDVMASIRKLVNEAKEVCGA